MSESPSFAQRRELQRAQALRANLRRRKGQARLRDDDASCRADLKGSNQERGPGVVLSRADA